MKAGVCTLLHVFPFVENETFVARFGPRRKCSVAIGGAYGAFLNALQSPRVRRACGTYKAQ
jgi:hypothetical protein